jgi:hypothetical protein
LLWSNTIVFFKIQSVLIYLIIYFDTNANRNPILFFFKKTAKIQPLSATVGSTYFYFNNFGFIMMFPSNIGTRTKSLLSTATIEKNITINEPDYFFLDEHQLDSSQILNEVDITSKINFNFIPDFLKHNCQHVSSLGVAQLAHYSFSF